MGFVGFMFLVIAGIHLYLWKRLVRDTLRAGPWRRVGGAIILGLAILVPATLILTRAGYVTWLAWPGYIWLAVMFYLLIILLLLEIPRLIIRLVWRLGERNAKQTPVTVGGGTSADAGGEAADEAKPGPAGSTATLEPTGVSGAAAGSVGGSPRVGDSPAGDGRAGKSSTASGSTAGKSSTASGSTAGKSSTASGSTAGKSSTASGSTAGDEGTAAGGGIDRRLLLARGAAIFAGLTAASVTGYGVRTALAGPRLDRVQIPIPKLPRVMDGTRIAVVSDIHLGPLTGQNHMSRIVSMINSTDADVVCIVGDMVDGTVEELGAGAAALRDIRSRQGAYFVTGNHEYYSGYQQWIDEVARLGVRPLRNERLEIVTRGGAFDLAGVNDIGGAEVGDGPDFGRALGDRDTSRPVVLMAHQPVMARDAAQYGVDLQVSGHTHGGQMMPFNYLVRVEQPVVSGFGNVDGVPVYVTNGAGFWGPPVRVGAPPQVTLIEMRTP